MYEVSAGVRSTRNEDGGIVLDTTQNKIFRLNGVGALIFERLGKRQCRLQIIHEVSQQFNVPAELVEADVVEFLDSLRRQGLVQDSLEETP